MNTDPVAEVLGLLKDKAKDEASALNTAEAVAQRLAELGLTALSHYEVLGLTPDAGVDQITKRYRELVRKCHPDAHGGSPLATAMTTRLNQAYEALSDPAKRLAYDRKGHQDEVGATHLRTVAGAQNAEWAQWLADVVARGTFCRLLLDTHAKPPQHIFIGAPTNVRVAADLYHWLRLQLEDLAHLGYRAQFPTVEQVFPGAALLADGQKKWINFYGQWERVPRTATKAQVERCKVGSLKANVGRLAPTRALPIAPGLFKRSFLTGGVHRLAARIKAVRAAIDADTMAVTRVWEQAADDHIAETWGAKLRPIKPKATKVNHAAFQRGQAAGDSVQIETQVSLPENFPFELRPQAITALENAKEEGVAWAIIEWRAVSRVEVVPLTTYERDLGKSDRVTLLWLAEPDGRLVNGTIYRPAIALEMAIK